MVIGTAKCTIEKRRYSPCNEKQRYKLTRGIISRPLTGICGISRLE
jgi:hypothetical protein